MAAAVFFISLKWPQIIAGDSAEPLAYRRRERDGRLSRLLVSTVVGLWGVGVFLFGAAIVHLRVDYLNDWRYFINRASMHADFGRQLYTEIEYPYGPLLFYGPLSMRALLSPLHVSLAGSYLVTLVLEVMAGLVLVAYVIDYLTMSRRWKTVIFLLMAGGMMVGNMGVNYTFLRFAPPVAFLVLVSRRERPWVAALWMFVGEAVCLGLSPEIGFAFLVGSLGFALYQCFAQGRMWVFGLVAPVVSTAVFLWIAGRPYLTMLGMFSHGLYNFPVEPLPHILIFLFAFVWMVPAGLAPYFRDRRTEAPILGAIFLVSMALLPAGFGRADPAHIYWNGFAVFLLSIVMISSKRMWQQMVWGGCVAVIFVWMVSINRTVNWSHIQPVLHGVKELFLGAVKRSPPLNVEPVDAGFDLNGLQTIVGHDRVATPVAVSLGVEESLRESGQFTPSFYCFSMAILDAAAEKRQIREMNQYRWALIPAGGGYDYRELPERLKGVLGLQLPYRTRRPIFPSGARFERNLEDNWRPRGKIQGYILYEHV